MALAEGSKSNLWAELKTVLPDETFSRFAQYAGVKEKHIPVWNALREEFESDMEARVTAGDLTPRTRETYVLTLNEFEEFLREEEISLLEDINRSVFTKYRAWRLARVQKSRKFRSGATIDLELDHLHHVFAFAEEEGLISKNPVHIRRKKHNPSEGAQPFSGEELIRLREAASFESPALFPTVNHDWLLFVLFRRTGFRVSDAVSLNWGEVNFSQREIKKVCKKNHRKVVLPIHSELLKALEQEYERRKPQADETVLLNPANGKPYTGNAVYLRFLSLGKRAGVAHVHPHRFRDTYAVDLLLLGADTSSVANLLGDGIDVVVERYVPFVKELRERARLLQETGSGLEQYVTPAAQSDAPPIPSTT